MARLNEPPAPASSSIIAQPASESVDARRPTAQRPAADLDEVRRRFVRQNRELAKNNSTQSLKIRNLELEISRLQADNLDLREQVLSLQNELYSARVQQPAGDAVRRVREELQAKLAELSELVEGIDALAQSGSEAARPLQGKKVIESRWRERQPLIEVMRESAMPTITEDKQYPRRTLGADEIQAIRLSDHSSTGSPDLGPPPVAHFDFEDPVKQGSPSAAKSPPVAADEDELPAELSVNLETRRRRKDGQPRLEIRRHSVLMQSPEKRDAETSTILRTGAKRKLADRDLDKPIKPPVQGDFSFSRKTSCSETKDKPQATSRLSSSEDVAIMAPSEPEAIPTPPKPTRRVLGDKSTNMSPRKTALVPDKDSKDVLEKPVNTRVPAKGTAAKRRTSSIPQLLLSSDAILPTVELPPPTDGPAPATHPPKTPAPPPLLSPTPSEPSAARLQDESVRAGTPPPGDLSTLSTTTDGGTRPSRRARAAVSYAEPSLVAKLRRPGKRMVDAVTGLQDPRRSMSTSSERKPATSRTAKVKEEPVDDMEERSWKDLPAADEGVGGAGSPLGTKSAEHGHSSDIATAVVDSAQDAPPSSAPSAASATISALMAGSRKRREPSTQPLVSTAPLDLAKKLEDLDIYDFKDSSSPEDAVVAKGRTHRRHSSICKDADAPTTAGKGLVAGMGRSERAAHRRRSMVL